MAKTKRVRIDEVKVTYSVKYDNSTTGWGSCARVEKIEKVLILFSDGSRSKIAVGGNG